MPANTTTTKTISDANKKAGAKKPARRALWILLLMTLGIFLGTGLLHGEDFDWRNIGGGSSFVTPVRDQGHSGMCWAFASTAALESMYKITRNDPTYDPNLSEQQLACAGVGDAIAGGWPSGALAYFQNTGVVTEQELPFTGTNYSPFWPLADGWQDRVYKIDSRTEFIGSVTAIKNNLKRYGPLITQMRVDSDWYGAEHGASRGDHSVVITGFHDDASLPGGGYFIIKNSWGDQWGDQGYGKILYNAFGSYFQFAINKPAYTTGPSSTLNFDTSSSAGYQPGNGLWSTGTGDWSADGVNLNVWRNGEDAAVFASGGGAYTVNVDNNISAHAITFQNGAGGYTLTGGSLTVTHGGITAYENAEIQSEITVGAPQQWTVAGGKTLSIGGAVNTHISPLTISGDGDTVIRGVIRDVRADPNFSGLLADFSGSLLKTGDGTLRLTAANIHTGRTKITGGTLALSGPAGAILTSPIYLAGGKLLLDNAADNNLNRIASPAGVDLQGGELALSGSAAGTSETIDKLLLSSSYSTITVAADTNVSYLIAPNLGRNRGATALVRGSGLGSGGSGAIGRIRFNTAPTLSNSGSGDQIGIIPYLIGDDNITGVGSNLVTYDGNGLRPLASSEYVYSFQAGKNVRLTDSQVSTDTIGILSLDLDNNTAASQITINPNKTLTVTNGAILSTGNNANSISGGKITFGNNSATQYEGIIHANADITVQSSIADNSGHPVTLTKGGAGTLILTGNNTYGNGTNVAGGTLQIGDGGVSGSIVGDIANNSILVFNHSNNTTFSGSVYGNGTLIKKGQNTLILTGTDSCSGGTIIAEGTLQVGDGWYDSWIEGPITNNGTLAFNLSYTVEFSNSVSGSGGLVQLNTENLILTGENTYTGDTTIMAGILWIGNGGTKGSIAGNLVNNSELEYNRSDNVTYGGAISGSGKLTKYGKGTLLLTATSSYEGDTIIAKGTLKLGAGASLASRLVDVGLSSTFDVSSVPGFILDSGKTIEGNGSVAGAVTVLGTVCPGESAGRLTVGDMTFGSGGMLSIELGGTSPGTLYDVLNSTGALSLQPGSKLKLSLLNGFSPNVGNVFDILNFSGLSGEFSILDLPALAAGRSWNTNSLYLNGTILVVPEPAALLMLLTALGAIVIGKKWG